MKVQKVIRAQGEFAKPNQDFKDGDVLTLLDGGQVISGTYGDQNVFKIKTPNGEKILAFNQTSMNNLIEEFGDETDSWVGKDIRVFLITQSVSGKMRKVCYLTATNWDMIEDASDGMSFGKKAVEGQNSPQTASGEPMPTPQGEGEIKVEDIPI